MTLRRTGRRATLALVVLGCLVPASPVLAQATPPAPAHASPRAQPFNQAPVSNLLDATPAPAPAPPLAPAHDLPGKLLVLDFDPKLNAVLLSGEFQNDLGKPVRAWRADVELRGPDSDEPLTVHLEHQMRRPIRAGHWGRWSRWIDIDDTVAEQRALRDLDGKQARATLRLRRVLFGDGSQMGFERAGR